MSDGAQAARNLDALDGLRGFAALLVMFGHMGNWGLFFEIRGAGQLGVMIFFALSGFLMAYLYVDRTNGWQGWAGYGIRRFMRVYPLYAFAALFAFLMASLGYRWVYGPIGVEQLIELLTLEYWRSVWWTIPVEMKFYAVFPFIALGAAILPDARWRIAYLLLLVLLGFSLGATAERTDLLRGLPFFLTGALAGYLQQQIHTGAIRPPGWVAPLCFALGAAGLVIVFPNMAAWIGWTPTLWLNPWSYAIGAALLVFGTANTSGIAQALFANPFARHLGFISFSVYLFHIPVLNVVRRLDGPAPVLFLLACLAVLLAANLTERFVENPSRALGSVWARKIADLGGKSR